MFVVSYSKEYKLPWTGDYHCTGYGNGGDGCGARLLVSDFDLKITTPGHHEKENEEELHLTFVCPLCIMETDIPASDVPEETYEMVREKSLKKTKSKRGRR